MIIGSEIDLLVQLFLGRRVALFHACQLIDFYSYIRIGGVPSHSCLEKADSQFTPFETDTNDKNNGVWDKVFVNLSDFGSTFANGGRSVPNPYGPILICIKPEALLEATDVAICLKSAGEFNFDREREALNLDEVEKLFAYPASFSYPESTRIKYRKTLREEFNNPKAADPEISCSYAKGKIPLEYVKEVIVDPYVINKTPLVERVRATIAHHNGSVTLPVHERSYGGARWYTRKPFYNKLALAISEGYPLTLQDLLYGQETDETIRIWAGDIESLNLSYQFRRYAQYLYNGTLNI